MSGQPSMPRFYGGHYDSVKQGAYRDFLVSQQITVWHEELRRRYTARLRLDILLGANVVVTDAQFYDGLLFHTIVSSETHRRDFYEFLGQARERLDAPLIEVRRRKGGLLEMFGKPFVFSSLITGQAKDQVTDAMQRVLARGKETGKAYEEWKTLMQDVLYEIETQSAKERMQQVIEAIALLNEAPIQIFRNWEPERVHAYPQLLNDAKRELKFKVPRSGNEEIDETLTKVENEMEKERPIRSDIEKWIRDCKNADPSDDFRRKLLDGVWNQVLQVYNRAIANQHRCISMDLGETLLSPKESQDVVAGLPPTTIGAIADQSWTDFWQVVSSGYLAKAWKQWRDIICEPHRFKPTYILRSLVDLVGHIEKSYGQWSTGAIDMLVGGGSSTLTFSANGLSLSFDPIKLTTGLVLGAKSTVSGWKEGFNLVKHGLRILDLASKEG